MTPPGPRAAPLLPPLTSRVASTAALGAFGALHWAAQVEPAASGRMLLALAAGLAAGLAARETARLSRSARAIALPLAVLAGLTVAGLAAGLPARFLVPAGWPDLGGGIGGALSTLPGIRVPYAGIDEWVRWTILAGGALLAAGGALLALAPRDAARGRWLAVLPLALLFAIPVVSRDASTQFLDGAVFALLLAAFLSLDRVPLRGAGLAAGIAGLAALLGLAGGAAVDRDRPLLDYEAFAESLERRNDPRFEWRHRYGPMTWSRDGREVLRIRARRPSYWKAENLDSFDGVRWTGTRLLGRQAPDVELPRGAQSRPGWLRTIRVRITGMRTREIIGAGTTLGVLGPPRPALPSGSPGTYVTTRELERGDTYHARVYVPDPTAEQLATAGASYPDILAPYRTIALPGRAGAEVTFPPFGTADRASEAAAGAGSPYRRSYALARRLAAASRTPYGFVGRVQAHLERGYRYSESPPARAIPLESFLFDDRAGYCQQFSGAMALLLRMGGVPARVATGFASGVLDRRRREYVVSDLDAHSWVEAYFPGYGWVSFDPTPAAAPARSRAQVVRAPAAAAPGGDGGTTASGDQLPAATDSREDGGPWSFAALALVGVAVAGVVVGGLALAGYRGARRRRPDPDPVLAELERALRRSGRPPAPGTTLRALERSFAASPGAAGYLREVRALRYGFGKRGPRRAHRRALRGELGRGRGPLGRLRAWWALPPRRRHAVGADRTGP